jgi:regulator of protease activity HflC (stomatin/prohibitin superfamily)
VQIRTGTVGIIESFGKFTRVAEPGETLLEAPLGDCVPFERIARTMSMRVQQQRVDVNTKTSDDVFCDIEVAVLFKIPSADRAKDAAYKLTDIRGQLSSFVEDTLRSTIAKVKIDDVFTMSKDLSKAVLESCAPRMAEYGYEVLDTLVVGIEPEARVKNSMNEINYQQRLKNAQVHAAEASKAIEIKLAEARAEAKHLSGIGLARQRRAMIDGFSQSIATVNVADDDKFSSDATELLLTTQYMDMLEAIPHDGQSGVQLFLPTDIAAIDSMRDRLTMFATAFKKSGRYDV